MCTSDLELLLSAIRPNPTEIISLGSVPAGSRAREMISVASSQETLLFCFQGTNLTAWNRRTYVLLFQEKYNKNSCAVKALRKDFSPHCPQSTTHGTVNRKTQFFLFPRGHPLAIFVLFFQEIQVNRKRQTSGAVQVFVRITKIYYKQKNTKNRLPNMTIPLP